MKNKPICSSCGREINEDEILRSVALVGAGRITEYIVCDRCFMHLTDMFRDNPQNQPLKRLEGRTSFNIRPYRFGTEYGYTIKEKLDEWYA